LNGGNGWDRQVVLSRGVGDYGADVVLSERRKIGENILDAIPLSEAGKNSADRDTSALDYSLTAAGLGVAG
jgi:hypothetical protein